ncbi:uncharacterized protein east isoform X2 [Venturia canescens]|uniref:uncharacterized protein east isoform X2 n=1 Tax=Venturia canescens TaxID=32260 RepID=UPI001C9D2048|nr:uncharacterized protein LOC122415660 isoform X2 [Venturia canescens]
MASREKRPLAPSKTKQKANNAESILGSAQNNRKRNQPSHKQQQQLAREILEVVAGGSEISPRLEASLPRKQVLRSLRRKQKLRNAKSNLINSKVTKKVPIKNIRRITVDVKKGVKLKRVKRLVEADRQVRKNDEDQEVVEKGREEEGKLEGEEEEDTENEAGTKKSNRKKATKGSGRVNEETESVASNDREIVVFENLVSASTRNSPKSGRKLKNEGLESPSKSSKTQKNLLSKRNASKERDTNVNKNSINPKSSGGSSTTSPETKNLKKSPISNSSVDLTIEEVVASMLSDTENEDCQVVGGKLTRSRKMLIDEKQLFTDVEIKKEVLESEETRSINEEDRPQTPHQDSQTSIQLRNRSGNSFGQRSLRNGKLRQLSDSGISLDTEVNKKRRWPNMDESSATLESGEMSVDNVSDVTIDAESSFSESSGHDNQSGGSLPSNKDETSPIKLDSPSDFDRVIDSSMELENNNNGERCDRIGGVEIGPILRSKTKAKSTEIEIKIEDPENDELRPLGGRSGNIGLPGQLESPRKSGSLDQLRKDNLSKITIENKSPKSRRSSLNIDVKKTMSSFYTNDKSENSSKSHIDQMIENIKLTIAKSIESKIFGPEKSLVRSKNFEVPKIEEIVAPLSAESQKLGIIDDTLVEDNDKPTVSKSEVTASNSSDNSVPKVADTAKEIEKLVMGECELVETHNSESASGETPRIEQQVDEQQQQKPQTSDSPENVETTEDNNETSEKSDTIDQDDFSNEIDKTPEERLAEEESSAEHQREARKSIVTRQSLRIKSSSESILDLDSSGKSSLFEDGDKVKSNPEDSPSEENPSNNIKELNRHSAETIEQATNETTNLQKNNQGENSAEYPSSDFSVEPNVEPKPEEKKDTVDLNISNVPEDSETLESISKEVERLVGDTPPNTVDRTKLETKKQESCKVEENLVEETATCSNAEKNEIEKSETLDPYCTDDRWTNASSSSPNQTETTPRNDADENPENGSTKLHKTNNNPTESEGNAPENADKESPSKEASDCGQESRSDSNKSKNSRNKEEEEQKFAAEENRRVLRARDRLKKAEAKQNSGRGTESVEIKLEPELHQELEELQDFSSEVEEKPNKETENTETGETTIKLEEPEIPARTRRSREVKKRKEEFTTTPQNTLKNKRSRKDVRKSDQQNKEETLLDNEVATINENNCSLVDKYDKVLRGKDNLRGFSEGGRGPVEKLEDASESNRSKSENDIENVKGKSECSSDRLSRERVGSDTLKENENVDGVSDLESKIAKTPETPQKDSDEASTSGESSSSLTIGKIDETPEDKAKKESILRLLGLESLEKAAERLNHQKARKEQYTGTLKTVIRVQKDKDKKRSRSPLKMVLKQGRGDGDGDSPEFYTIQKEFGTSGLGDSSSDEDTEEAPPKDRQSLVIPEKSSSFSIHPGRLCADVCCYCFGKFGSLDTPMHLAQMKSDERRQKILSIEKHLNKDSCLCDACYRHVDRRANTSPTNMQTKPQRQHRQLMVSKCLARDCREPARHHIKRRWLLKVKAVVQHQVDINWELSQHTSMSFCVDHYSKIEPYLTCALCKRRLAKNHTHPLAASEIKELNQRLYGQGIPVHLVAGTFVCKLCRYFTQLQLKYKYLDNMNASHKTFCKTYRIRILHCHDIEVFDGDEDDATAGTSKDKEKRKKAKCNTSKNTSMSKSPDGLNNSASEKSTPEPIPKNSESGNSETDNENRGVAIMPSEEAIGREVQLMDLESTVEKLKKRKALEQLVYTSEPLMSSESRSGSDVVEILAMDKEVTLTRLPKRPRMSNDITPVVQRLGANPSISVRTLFPGEEEMNLHANVEFTNVREITPQGWEKCATMIQYDRDTKLLWQELQRPYGNQSSFLRHLILLEKYYRSGDLVLAPNASRNAINYSTSVQNRLISYEGPEKMDEPIMEPISSEYNSPRRLSGGYVMERDRLSLPGTSTSLLSVSSTKTTGTSSSTTTTSTSVGGSNTPPTSTSASANVSAQNLKLGPQRVLKLTSGVSIIKKPPPSLQRLNLPSGSSSSNGGPTGGNKQRKEPNKIPVTSGGKVFQLSEAEFRRLQNLKKQKQLLTEQQKQSSSPSGGSSSPNPNATISLKPTGLASQYQKAQIAAQTQFQKHLRMQQEMLNRQTRGDFEPLICDVRSLSNENTPTQNLINTLNLPKSIQVTTKPPNPIPILPKIPKSLTVIPQTVSRPLDK